MDDYWTIPIEFPEEALNTAAWYAPRIVTKRINEMVSAGKQPPDADVIKKVLEEVKQMIAGNVGSSSLRPINFGPILERLENT